MEPGFTRRPGEIRNADEVLAGNALAVPFQCIERTLQQDRRNLVLDSGACRISRPGDGRKTDQTGR